MRVEVAYARPDLQVVLEMELAEGATAMEAILASGILERFPEIDFARNGLGVYGRLAPPERILRPGDRVEIYRPLLADPKAGRRLRAARG